MIDKTAVRQRALDLAARGGRNVASTIAHEFGISRQAANTHLALLVKAGDLEARGETRARIYHLIWREPAIQTYVRENLSEDRVWRELCAPVVTDLPENVRNIWHYGITEMVNNAIDHSESAVVHVGMRRNALYTQGWVADEGIGIFRKIQEALDLYDPREAILELAKGKFTTDPANHTGEGIFFSSKMFDSFDIRSSGLHFAHDDGETDVLFEAPTGDAGTVVVMQLANHSSRTEREVFDRFALPDEYTFAKTIVPVRLAQHEGEKLVSRSQAKRLTMRFERFEYVVLDFTGVEEIGQAFADEVFRVFQEQHPRTILVPANMTAQVEAMVKRAQAPR